MSQPTEIHTLAGAYALDALTELERTAFARHVRDCPSCAIEVAELSETASRLGATSAQAPPARLRDAVLSEVARTRQVSATGLRQRGSQTDAVRRWRRWTMMSAAAGLIAIGGVGTVWTVQQRRIDDLRGQSTALKQDQARIDSVLTAGDAKVSSAPAPGGGQVVVVTSASRGDGVAVMSDLPALPSGKAYQLWLMDGTSALSIGVMPPGAGSGTALVPMIGPGRQVGVTIEPASGSPAPTSDPLTTLTLA